MGLNIRGCKVRKLEQGFAVKNTVFKSESQAELYAYYLRIVLVNKSKLHYVKDMDEAIEQILRNENRTDTNGSQRQWLEAGWRNNEGKYLHVRSGMYAINNLNEK